MSTYQALYHHSLTLSYVQRISEHVLELSPASEDRHCFTSSSPTSTGNTSLRHHSEPSLTSFPRCLALWEADPSLLIALDLCKTLLPWAEYQTYLWPSRGELQNNIRVDKWLISCIAFCSIFLIDHERKNAEQRERILKACSQADIPPPAPLVISMY